MPYEKIDQPFASKPAAVSSVGDTFNIGEDLVLDDKKPTILIVEDNPDLQFYLKAELSNDFHIITEDNGLDGLNTAVFQIPDLIVSDVMMPKLDGNKMCKQLKTNDKTCHIPIILLTAKGTDRDRVIGLSTGADVYLSKPFNIDVLKAQIVSMIENRIALQKSLARQQKNVVLERQQNELDKRFIHSTIEIIHQNIDVPGFTPEQLAEQLSISQRQLYRKMKAITGNTVHEFIIKLRMEKATELLQDWQLNISEIADRVGFSESSNFSRTFRKHYGCAPSKYRQEN